MRRYKLLTVICAMTPMAATLLVVRIMMDFPLADIPSFYKWIVLALLVPFGFVAGIAVGRLHPADDDQKPAEKNQR